MFWRQWSWPTWLWRSTSIPWPLGERRLRPAFVAAAQPEALLRRGFSISEIADEAVLHLPDFCLRGSPGRPCGTP